MRPRPTCHQSTPPSTLPAFAISQPPSTSQPRHPRKAFMRQSFSIGIGGAAGQGVATPGDIFAKIFSRRGLHLNAYNAYQSIIRGGHTFLTIRTGPEKVSNMGDRIDLLIPLNQDAMDRHFGLLHSGAACIYNADTIRPGIVAEGTALCPLPVSELADIT